MVRGLQTVLFVMLVAVIVSGSSVAATQWNYEDGTYRGIFADGSEIQVSIQFTLADNIITNIRFRGLAYRGVDYRASEDEMTVGLLEQHEELIQYLVGKDIRSSLDDLRQPGEIVDTTVADAFTGATLRGNKIISAMRDALNRGVYSY